MVGFFLSIIIFIIGEVMILFVNRLDLSLGEAILSCVGGIIIMLISMCVIIRSKYHDE